MLNIFSYFFCKKSSLHEGVKGDVRRGKQVRTRENPTRVLQRLFQDRTRVGFWLEGFLKLAVCSFFILAFAPTAFATTGWTTDATTCDSSYLSIDCPENQNICGYVSSTLYCANPATINAALPSAAGTADDTDVQGSGGYQVNCTQTTYDCTTPASVWDCKASSTCATKNLKTTCAGSAHTTSCGTCLTGYLDCDGVGTGVDANGCEIEIGGVCTNNGVAGTYGSSCVGSTPPVCNTGPVDVYTGTLAEQSTTDPLFWGKQYGTGDLFNISKNGGSSVVIDNDGKVGIGTTSPTNKLSVLGTATQLGLKYDASNYFDFNVRSNGTLQLSQDGSSATMTLEDGNVGIGEDTPTGLLHVGKKASLGSELTINGFFESDITGVYILTGTGGNAAASHEIINPISGTGSLKVTQTISPSESYRPNVTIPTDSVEIGKTYRCSFDTRLDSGTMKINTNGIWIGGTHINLGNTVLTGSQSHFFDFTATETGGNVKFYLEGTESAAFELVFDNISVKEILVDELADILVVNADGNVGIGTTTPSQALDVTGSIALNGTRVVYMPTEFTNTLIVGNGGNNLTHTTGNEGYFNTFVGFNTGVANTTGYYNNTIGYSALSSNTTGKYSNAIGSYALRANTTGYYNNAIGYFSLYANTTGDNNNTIGNTALSSNTTGDFNIAIGAAALFNNITGSSNIAVGKNAGRLISDGVTGNETASSSFFMGNETRAHADGEINQIVIGSEAIGIGSNTVVLGNDSIVTTALKGNVGIGTTTPSTLLTLANDGWISAVDSSGTGVVNMMKVNTNDEIEIGGQLNIGTLGLSEDSGAVTMVNMPVSSVPVSGTEESYSFSLDSDPVMKIYGEADGTGGVQNKAVNITGDLNVSGTSTLSNIEISTDTIGAPLNTDMNFQTGTSALATRITIADDGNVGIGTGSPGEKLDVNGNLRLGDSSYITLIGDSGYLDIHPTSDYGLLVRDNGDDTNYAVIGSNPGYASFGYRSVVGTDSINVGYSGKVGIGTTAPTAKLQIKGAGTTTGVNFQTTDSADSALVTVLDSGNVGIGTTSPESKLHTTSTSSGETAYALRLVNAATADNTATGITFANSTTQDQNHASIVAIRTNAPLEQNVDLVFSTTEATSFRNQEKMRITGAGNVGIGTTTPTAKLQIKGAGTTTGVNFQTTDSADSALVTVLDSGNVGIGTTTPSTLLTLANDNWISAVDNAGTGSVNMMKVNADDEIEFGAPLNIGTLGLSDDSGLVGLIDMGVTATPSAGTVEGYSFAVDASDIMTVYAEADGSGGVQNKAVNITGDLNVSGTSTLSNIEISTDTIGAPLGQDMNFQSGPTAGTLATRMTIADDGNVGIGTTSPSYKLDINGDARATSYFASGSHVLSSIYGYSRYGGGGLPITSGYGAGVLSYINFLTNNAGTATERMRITGDGNVGIGTTAPTNNLSVTPTQYSTGTASQSTTTITGVGTTFTSAMVGSQFVFADGTSAGTITAFGSATSLTVSASQTVTSQAYNIAYTGLQVDSTGNVGIGTASPSGLLDLNSLNSETTLYIDNNAVDGDPVIRYQLGGSTKVVMGVDDGDSDKFKIVYSTGFAGASGITLQSNGNVGIGTTTPSTLLTLANNGWISGADSAGTGVVNMFKVNTANEIEVGGRLNIGTLGLAEDSGLVTLANMPVSSVPASGTDEGYAFSVDSEPIMTIFAEADGTGGIQNKAVNITGDLNVSGTSTLSNIEISTDTIGAPLGQDMNFQSGPTAGTLATRMTIADDGNVGIGTTSPVTKLEISGGAKIGTDSTFGVGSTESCTTSLKGTVQYNDDQNAMNYCNGTAWVQFGVSGCPTAVRDNDGNWYDTVQIGDQCWTNQHMNVGTKVDDPGATAIAAACAGNAGTVQTIGGIECYCTTETYASCQRGETGGTTLKYCYSNDEANCTANGALYEWQEAMDLPANCAYTDCSAQINTPHQGICPDGWHIPTDTEWKTLEGQLGMSTAQQDTTGWRGTNEGDKLKTVDKCFGSSNCSTSGFSALLAGYRYVSGGFFNSGSYASVWSSSQNSSASAWGRYLISGYSTIYRYSNNKYSGFSLRCLKD